MQNFLLYSATVLIWGTTWIAIVYQLGTVDPMVSVIYRFALASLLLLAFCAIRKLPMRFHWKDHIFIALQGAFLFALNYWLFYIAEQYIKSGLVSVVFSGIVIMNIFNGFLFLRSPIHLRVIFGSSLGFIGIACVFWPELSAFEGTDQSATGLLLCIAATFFASLGNIIAARNQQKQLPVIQTNAYGMLYGCLLLSLIAFFLNKSFAWDSSWAYLSSLIYLSIFGSIIAFGCYLTLIGRIGADRAAYATLLFPIIALGISTVFEDYQWSTYALVGIGFVLAGNGIILRK